MSKTELLWVSAACRNAQTGQNSASSGSSVPHSGQARLAGVVATVSSSPPGSYSILAIVAYEKNRLMNAACLREEFKGPDSDFVRGNGFVTKGIWALAGQTERTLGFDELDSG